MSSVKKEIVINRLAINGILGHLGFNQKEIQQYWKECEKLSDKYFKNEGGVKNEKSKNNDK